MTQLLLEPHQVDLLDYRPTPLLAAPAVVMRLPSFQMEREIIAEVAAAYQQQSQWEVVRANLTRQLVGLAHGGQTRQ
ncbi:hypothetical protein AYR62_14500 [Secundilactobacillus paracollinoides]|uniref:Uncharacterized protein n=1 Tax=Secundilactobacillus paracollinoides TaxID=240427 RepID=A0A1B2IX84_9LACO|nr:hypothetical protein [Secundilactobacillus paracollinoides]ANZ60794.1 hypothetical protein AYR61_05195 [Secundilactobacillus paracollinoides]ANZ65167.1 hypothetical protein AYR62_14500 [Secundilactobacillus paracollinoides]ANZ66639.1 hypothetical protein AYR63_05490 [Secundilactobacillus paracollinoides]KRL79919.1 hypothetical protein FC17_GL000161 [Secundilactobacillus paracollinoides DSM 15502 = JCM 11969]